MRTVLRIAFVVLACLVWVLAQPGPAAFAKGRGGGGGGGHKGAVHASHGRAGGPQGQSAVRGSSHTGTADAAQASGGRANHSSQTARGGKQLPSLQEPAEGIHPWSMQRANEDRKLQHRLSTADRLDQIADRTGNENLHETANRMRQKAQELYDKRMAKIDSKEPLLSLGDDAPDAPEPLGAGRSRDGVEAGDAARGAKGSTAPPAGLPKAGQKLTGRENALSRQLGNEDRNLAKRLQAAERLWQAYEQNGDEELAQAARHLEERALAHYERRLEAIRGFQERHGVEEWVGDRSPPDAATGLPALAD